MTLRTQLAAQVNNTTATAIEGHLRVDNQREPLALNSKPEVAADEGFNPNPNSE